MPIFHLKSDLISPYLSVLEICLFGATRPSSPASFSPRRNPGTTKIMASKLQAVSVGGVSTQGPRGSAGIVVPLQTPGWRAGQGHSRGSRSRGSPPWTFPDPGAPSKQRGAAAAVAGGGGPRGAQREAWPRDLCGWRGGLCQSPAPSFPGPRSQAPCTTHSPSFQGSRIKVSRFPGPKIPSLQPFLL